ncbi:hypothetical protein ACQPU1_09195 [Clostridium paraputrificum]|uniref:hypothetical protein n=1 Tax=Clostridium TaxID=1485 RepID=UPI003D32BE5B
MKDKLLYNLAESIGLTFVNQQDILYGLYRGYNLTINSINYVYFIYFPVRLTNEFGLNDMNKFLNELKGEYKKIKNVVYKGSEIQLEYAPRTSNNGNDLILLSILDKIVNMAMINNLLTCCGFCGEFNESPPFLLNNIVVPRCKNCQNKINNVIHEQRNTYESKKNKIFLGIIGSLLGACIGSFLWVIIAQMNYIAAIAGFAIALCSIKGYEKFGGKLNISGIVITSIITIIMVFFASYISLAFDIYLEYKADYLITFFDAFKSVPEFLTAPEIKDVFMKDLAIGYLLTILGSISFIIRSYKNANYRIETEEIEL